MGRIPFTKNSKTGQSYKIGLIALLVLLNCSANSPIAQELLLFVNSLYQADVTIN